MTIDEARLVLGISADAPEGEVRRAYTRLVKQHKPDKDPDGFRRVREAYERLTSAHPVATPGPVEAASVEAPSSPDAAPAAPATEPATAMDPGASRQRDLAKAREELSARLDAATVPATLAELLRAHLAAYPDDDVMRFEAIALLARMGLFPAAIELIDEGTRVGARPLVFAAQLAQWKPSALGAESLRELGADPVLAPWAGVALFARGDREAARELLRATLQDDVRAGRKRRPEWLAVIAALFERDAGELALELYATLAEQLPSDTKTRGRGTTELLVRELVDVAGTIDPELFRTLARFVASPVRGGAVIAADPLMLVRHDASLAKLRARAPQLTRIALPQAARPASRSTNRKALLSLGALLLAFLAIPVLDFIMLPERHPWHTTEATRAICDGVASRPACDASRQIDYYLERSDCHHAGLSAMTLIAETRYTGDAWPETLAQRERVLAQCPELR